MKVILLGATGRIGAATLKALLSHPEVSSVVALTRKTLPNQHAKLRNVVHGDFTSWPKSLLLTELADAEACIWTLGIRPSLIKSYAEAHPIEVEAPISAAKSFIKTLTPKVGKESKFRFMYVSGMASERDSTKALWFADDARKLKGETENELHRLNEQALDMFEGYVARSGHVVSDAGGLFGGFAGMIPSMAIKESELAMAMIDIVLHGGGERRSWENAQLVARGREALAEIQK